MKLAKSYKQAHTANTKYGMGNNYGSGIKNPVGKMRMSFIDMPVSKNKISKPPKSLA